MRKFLLLLGLLIAVTIAPVSAADLTEDQRKVIDRLERYLNGLSTLEAKFVQIASDGSAAEGKLYLQRPGKMRFDYADPTPILLVANGYDLIYFDRELENATYFDPDDTPAGLFLDETIRFSGKVTVTDLSKRAGAIRLTVVQTEDPLAGSIEFVFTTDPMALRQWTVTDPQGIESTVTLFDTVTGHALDPELFKFQRRWRRGVDD